MPALQALYDIQSTDLEIGARRARIESVNAQINNESALAALRALLADKTATVHALAAQQRQYEDQSSALAVRINKADAQLYGGAVKNPRELQDLQADIAQLNRQRDEQEFLLLEVMEQLEPLKAEQRQTRERLASAEARWRDEQAALMSEHRDLEARITTLDAKRAQQAAAIPPTELATYDRIRARHSQGRGIAKVHNRACESCRVGLPAQMLQELRTSNTPLRCPSCGLILMME